MQKGGFVYILSSPNRTTLYTGVTADLKGRVWEHRNKIDPKSFSAKYNCTVLVYYDQFDSIIAAIDEEKRIKGCSRKKKELLISTMNHEWSDLWNDVESW